MLLDVVSSLAGLIVPPAFDFIKKKFLKNSDDPISTLNNISTIKPEFAGQYVEAYAHLLDAQTRLYNRDVVGNPSVWIIDLRACIRPIFTIISVLLMGYCTIFYIDIDPSIKSLMEITIASWFGSKI